MPKSALSHATLRLSCARNAKKWATSLRTALRICGHATTVARSAICRQTVLRHPSVATATRSAIPERSAQSLETVSPVSRSKSFGGHTNVDLTGSRVQCSNCKDMGHTKVRCKQPLPNEDGDDGGFDNGGGGFDSSGDNGGFNNDGSGGFGDPAGAGDDWNTGAPSGGGGGGGDW
jgi:hypothetical protein